MAAAIRRVNSSNMMSIPRRRSVMANHRGGSGNFAEDRERASEAGKKGGKSSHGKSDN
ncbi:hypothetical protein [Escherichia coli O157:H7]|nr:hypothetical protein [Enterobacteria phage VT2-Sakai]